VFATGGGVESIPVRSDGRPWIAVLPFENRSADPEQEYFADGITEDIITELSRFRDFKVIAHNSVFVYKDQDVDIARVADDLGVRYIIRGSVRKAGNRIRVSAQLSEPATNSNLWAERYDRELVDIFDLQDDVTLAIVRAVAPRSDEAEHRRGSRLQSLDLGLWDTVARARYLLHQISKQAWDELLPFLRQAIHEYPDAAVLHGLMCTMLVSQIPFGWFGDQKDALREADEAAREAIRLDSQDANAHRGRAMVRLFQRRPDDAVDAAKMALALNPNSADDLGSAASVLGVVGEYDQAKMLLDRAVELSPNDPARPFWHVGTALGAFIEARYEEAIEACTISIEMNPSFPTPYRQRASALAHLGRLAEARRDVAKLLELAPDANLRQTRMHVPTSGEHMEIFLEGLRAAGLPE
jgi:TolB-like protein/Flp pilus assembly protein TadD